MTTTTARRLPRILAAALGMVFLTAGISPASATDSLKLHYNTSVDNVVCISADFPIRNSGWQIRAAATTWNSVQTNVRFVITTAACANHLYLTQYTANDDRAAWTDYAPNWSLSRLDATGTTWLYPDTTVHLNFYYDWNGWKCGARYLLAHEMGHALGMYDHSTGPTSVMSYGYDYNKGCGVPDAADIARVNAVYAGTVYQAEEPTTLTRARPHLVGR